MKSALLFIGLSVYLALPFVLWVQNYEGLYLYFRDDLPPGQLTYALSKLAGLCGVAVLGLQVSIGLRGPGSSTFRLHPYCGMIGFALVCLHVVLFMCATASRSGHSTLYLLIPDWSSGHYKFVISIGVIAFWGFLLTLGSGFARSVGYVSACWLHYLAAPLFVLAFVHSLLIGSDTRYALGLAFYFVIAINVVWALFTRVLKNRK